MLAACTPTPPEEEQAQLKYRAVPGATTCNCMGVNGTCNADCSITCDAGYGDCDASLANGCETQLNTISNCGQCGRDCSCYGAAMCLNGACAGTPEPNGTPCSMPAGSCSGSGVCTNLSCTCSGGAADMASSHDLSSTTGTTGTTTGSTTGSATSGHGKSGCEIGSGSLGGLFPLFVLGLFVAFRRRRSYSA